MTTPPLRDAAATKKRLIDAAAAEFAQYGIAGARVDRIAAESQSNKAQIYHYFGSKDGLFDAVFGDLVAGVLRDIPMDPDDLPEYAGNLFDGYERHPEAFRLAAWHRLERGGDGLIDAVTAGNETKAAAIAAAQERGTVSTTYPPAVLLGLVLHTAALWSSQTPEYLRMTEHLTAAQRRAVVVSAIRNLTDPEKPTEP